MKLFIRDQFPLAMLYLLQLSVIILIFWLDGSKINILIYASFLSTCLFIGYLVYKYATNQSFYKRLSAPLSKLDDLHTELQDAPLPESLDRFQKQLVKAYKQEIYENEQRLNGHLHFINQWVHQMKTPLSVIHLLIQDKDDQLSESINEEADRLKKGLELVLYSARLDTFDRDFYAENIDLHGIVRSITSTHKRLFIRKRVFPEILIEPSLTIVSDEKWLSFVITQIMVNAIRYTTNAGEKIIFRSKNHGDQKVLEVEDHGVGITLSDLPRVFDPYFTGENGRSFQESTGMGLYLAKQICEKLGHQIQIDSTPGKGTTVRILF